MLRLPGFKGRIIVTTPLMCSAEPCWRGGAHQERCDYDLSHEAWQTQHALDGMTGYIVLDDVWGLSPAGSRNRPAQVPHLGEGEVAGLAVQRMRQRLVVASDLVALRRRRPASCMVRLCAPHADHVHAKPVTLHGPGAYMFSDAACCFCTEGQRQQGPYKIAHVHVFLHV